VADYQQQLSSLQQQYDQLMQDNRTLAGKLSSTVSVRNLSRSLFRKHIVCLLSLNLF
jgi:hypothetical protein